MVNTRRTEARICPNWLERGCRAAECKRSTGGTIALITAVVLAVLGTLALIYSQGSTDLSSVSGMITLAAGGGLLVALAFFLAACITLSKPKSRERTITIEAPVQMIQESDLQRGGGLGISRVETIVIDPQQLLSFNFGSPDLLHQALVRKLKTSEAESQISSSCQGERVTRAELVNFVSANKANFLPLCQVLYQLPHITNAQLEEKVRLVLNRFSFSDHQKNCFEMWLLRVLRGLAVSVQQAVADTQVEYLLPSALSLSHCSPISATQQITWNFPDYHQMFQRQNGCVQRAFQSLNASEQDVLLRIENGQNLLGTIFQYLQSRNFDHEQVQALLDPILLTRFDAQRAYIIKKHVLMLCRDMGCLYITDGNVPLRPNMDSPPPGYLPPTASYFVPEDGGYPGYSLPAGYPLSYYGANSCA